MILTLTTESLKSTLKLKGMSTVFQALDASTSLPVLQEYRQTRSPYQIMCMWITNCTLNNVNTTAVIEHDISDHSPIVIAFQLRTDRKKNARPLVQKFPYQNQENCLTDLSEQLRSSAAVQQNDISELIKIMSNLTDKHFPKVQLSRRQYKIAKELWLTKGILKSITTQNKLYAKYKRSNSTSDHNIYKEYRNKLTRIKNKKRKQCTTKPY